MTTQVEPHVLAPCTGIASGSGAATAAAAAAVDGDGTLGEASQNGGFVGNPDYFPRAATIGDLTGDGIPDLLLAGDRVHVLRGRGDGGFSGTIHPASDFFYTAVATADFNADGKLDAVATETGADLWLGNGDGTLRDPIPFATGTSPAAVAVGDFNGDGKPDVATANGGSNNVSVLLNDGNWAGSKTFVGLGGAGSGGNWSNAANWSPAGAPAAGDHVSIGGKAVNLGDNATVASLSLSGGARLSVGVNGNRVVRTGALSISDNSALNRNDNDLIIDYSGAGLGASPIGSWNGASYTGVSGMIARGYTYGDWSGTGLVTMTSQARLGVPTLAAAEAAQLFELTGTQTAMFGGQTVDATAVLVKYTYTGDVNLDGSIDGADNWVQFPGTNRYEKVTLTTTASSTAPTTA